MGRKGLGILVCLITVSTILLAICYVMYESGRWRVTSARRLPDRYEGVVEVFGSTNDEDEDGIEDQRDILDNVLDYIQTRPMYQSKYYAGGYPDDSYGVCTDVVARGLVGAGYDLMALVEEDIVRDPRAYGIDRPDPNIDFRRVRNLKCFFERNSQSLTIDVSQISEWQGGDIVVFTGHIGIVSDRRNEHGVPYIIHHSSPYQLHYEEDILEKRGDIEGHYRVNGN